MKPKGSTNFHAFTIRFNGRANAIITELIVFPAFDPKSSQEAPRGYKTTALWDTGATSSVITPEVVAALGLVPVGKTRMRHAGGSEDRLSYMVNLGLPNLVMVSGVKVAEMSASSFGAIIGMDVIASGDFSITNKDGETCMTYRYPSIGMIDYVVDANRMKFAGTNRNAPCPCGNKHPNGKPVKYKDCHGRPVR